MCCWFITCASAFWTSVTYFSNTSVTSVGNVCSGRIRNRDGATSTQVDDLATDDATLDGIFSNPSALDFTLLDGAMIVDQTAPNASIPDDFCGNLREDGMHDLGAVEFDGDGPCDTSVIHLGSETPTMDAGMGPSDAGTGDGGVDAGSTDAAVADDTGARMDATSDGGSAPSSDEGCGCRASGVGRRAGWPALLFVLLGLVRRSRNRS